MELIYETIHHSGQIKMESTTSLKDIKQETIPKEVDEKWLRGMNRRSIYESLFVQQFIKSPIAMTNYDFFVQQLIKMDTPCLFSMVDDYKDIRKDTKGIAKEFASLETDKEILAFANKYGLLGILTQPSSGTIDYYYPTVFEPVYFWRHHIKEVKNLLKIYSTLKKKNIETNTDIIGDIVNYNSSAQGDFEWIDGGEKIPVYIYEEDLTTREDIDHLDELAGVHILGNVIRNRMKNTINLDFGDIVPSQKSSIGFRFKETYITNYLLGAIYYDLWTLISNNENVLFCPYCGDPFTKSGRKKFCSDSCRVMAHNAKKKGDK
ncbi:hypothetical protein [Pseudalkalibacillus salsuginis]|uniref:hypothetical protein n=1 Tax=Pseudalkalibacillus salsuginis TaxID=2910972 RepID=UPI001F1AA27B|nr:hypothetical protein [Pseudalkalibacillus salsuginis]MCF6409012.1 hypothetical protein [Pseudalkalibacillus salsuginis]